MFTNIYIFYYNVNMLGSNIKYYRLKNNYSIRQLATLVNVSPMAISYYENNLRRPSDEIIKNIAEVLKLKVSDFLTTYDTSFNIIYEDYFLNKISKLDKEFIDVQISDYLSRFNQILRFTSLEDSFIQNIEEKKLYFSNDYSNNALNLRKHLGLNIIGPLSLIDNLELNNIICIPIKTNSIFYVSTGKINNLRYIAYNSNFKKDMIYKHLFFLLLELYFKNYNYFNSSIIKKTYLSFFLPKKELNILMKNYNSLDTYEKIRIKYHMCFKEYYTYLKYLNIFSSLPKKEEESSLIEQSTLLNILLNQLKENNLINDKKYYELLGK